MAETHGIAQWNEHRLLVDSRGLGWHDAYTSLATEAPWRKTLRALPHYCLAYCVHRTAAVTRTIEGERGVNKFELRPRHFGVVPADRASSWTLLGNPDVQLVYLRRPMVDAIAEMIGATDRVFELRPTLGFADAMLEQLVLALLDAARHDRSDPTDGLYADHVIRMIAMHLVCHHSTRHGQLAAPAATTASRTRLDHVRDLIETALDEDLSLERLAAQAGIGAHAFAAAFTKQFGTPPHRYVVERRVERAKRLLSQTDTPIVDIAQACGFASQSHLATTFKLAVGLTPGQYRGSSQEGSRTSPSIRSVDDATADHSSEGMRDRWCP